MADLFVYAKGFLSEDKRAEIHAHLKQCPECAHMASALEKLVHSRPNSKYYIDAWDYYHNGVYQYTRYCVASL